MKNTKLQKLIKDCFINNFIFKVLIILIFLITIYRTDIKEHFFNNDGKIKINFIHIPKNGGTSIKYLNNSNIIYNPHKSNVFDKNLNEQLVILRDPIDRFQSAVRYALQKRPRNKLRGKLIDNKIDTPEKWVNILRNRDKKNLKLVEDEILNKDETDIHKIGKNYLKYKYTYTPQSHWINNPKHVILFENLEDELYQFCKFKNIKIKEIKKKNKTIKNNNDKLSEESINFLKSMYKKDIELYNKYKNTNIYDRLLH